MSDRAKLETELSFLSELERREVVTQMSLAQKSFRVRWPRERSSKTSHEKRVRKS